MQLATEVLEVSPVRNRMNQPFPVVVGWLMVVDSLISIEIQLMVSMSSGIVDVVTPNAVSTGKFLVTTFPKSNHVKSYLIATKWL